MGFECRVEDGRAPFDSSKPAIARRAYRLDARRRRRTPEQGTAQADSLALKRSAAPRAQSAELPVDLTRGPYQKGAGSPGLLHASRRGPLFIRARRLLSRARARID